MTVESALLHRETPPLRWQARLHIGIVMLLALACVLTADWGMAHRLQFAFYAGVCILASGVRRARR